LNGLLFHILADRIGLRGRAPVHYPMLKNSNFCIDHGSEDRWQPRWKIPSGFGGLTGFAPRDPLIRLAVTTTSLDDPMRAETRFSQWLNFRVFQQYLHIAAVTASSFELPESLRKARVSHSNGKPFCSPHLVNESSEKHQVDSIGEGFPQPRGHSNPQFRFVSRTSPSGGSTLEAVQLIPPSWRGKAAQDFALSSRVDFAVAAKCGQHAFIPQIL
jgi:hypothetical protein